MPISYEIHAERSLVICHVSGVLSGEELLDHYRTLQDEPLGPEYQQLAHLGDLIDVSASPLELKEAAAMQVFEPGSKRAIVAPDDLAYGMARIFAAYGALADQNISVFRSLEQAEQWLGDASSYLSENA